MLADVLVEGARTAEDAGSGTAPDAGSASGELEEKLADVLAFLRRRLTGEFEVDDFGFDPELTDTVLMARARPLYQRWFRVEVRGHREHPGRRRRARRRQPLRGDRDRLADDVDRRPRRAPAAPVPADARAPTSSSRCPSSASWPARAARPSRATPTPSGCSPAASSSACGPRVSRASASRSASGTSCSGSAAAGSSRPRCAPGRRSCRARSSAPRRSTRPRQHADRWPGCSACRTSRSRRRCRGWARSGSSRCRASGSSSSASRCAPTSTAEHAAEDPMLVFDLTDQVRQTIQQTLYALLVQRRSVFF